MTREKAVAEALAEIYHGAGPLEAEALLDQLLDRGFKVVPCRRQVTQTDDLEPLGGANPLGRSTG